MLIVGSILLYIIHIHIEVNIREGLYPDPISAVKQVRSIWLDGETLDTLYQYCRKDTENMNGWSNLLIKQCRLEKSLRSIIVGIIITQQWFGHQHSFILIHSFIRRFIK